MKFLCSKDDLGELQFWICHVLPFNFGLWRADLSQKRRGSRASRSGTEVVVYDAPKIEIIMPSSKVMP